MDSNEIIEDGSAGDDVEPAGSVIRVEGVYPLSVQENPFVVGRTVGDFHIGQRVQLCTADHTTHSGTIDGFHIRQHDSNRHVFVFSDDISAHVQPGDIIRPLPEGEVPP
ncbi:hypothetical protein [Nocardia sp. BMG51109]|uniref:hypothetical protein n=1 Tax=Nocardia sp. BMG51109 TaxID=1056816 RepID=UPI000464936A|nr:hypothetical protein [Nocardia sp. BMG51109]